MAVTFLVARYLSDVASALNRAEHATTPKERALGYRDAASASLSASEASSDMPEALRLRQQAEGYHRAAARSERHVGGANG